MIQKKEKALELLWNNLRNPQLHNKRKELLEEENHLAIQMHGPIIKRNILGTILDILQEDHQEDHQEDQEALQEEDPQAEDILGDGIHLEEDSHLTIEVQEVQEALEALEEPNKEDNQQILEDLSELILFILTGN